MSRFSDFVDAVHAELDDSTVLKLIGKKNEQKHAQQRRIIWMRDGGRVEPAEQAGGREENGNRTVSVKTRYERIEVHLLAESEDTLDTLFDNWIAALDAVATNSVVWEDDYLWTEEDHTSRQPMVVTTIYKKLPVAEERKPLVTITNQSHTCEIDSGD